MPAKEHVIEEVTITPTMAAKMLEHNTLNRPLRQRHVQRIAHQIETGKWRFNGDTIKIASTEDVLDGQHRLWAVIEANKPIRTMVVYGIDKDAFSTIDTLRSSRTGGDMVALAGAERYRNQVSTALAWLLRWQTGQKIMAWRNPANRIENSDIEQAFADNPGMINAVEAATRLRSLCNPAILGMLYYIMSNRNPDIADRMMETLSNPAHVRVTDPFFALRAWLLSQKRRDQLLTIAVTIKAANAAYEDKPIKHLKWQTQGQTAEEFPELRIGRAR